MKKIFIASLTIFFIFYSCSKDEIVEDIQADPSSNDITQPDIPLDFNFQTTDEINVDITVTSITNQPLSGKKVSFFTDHPDFGGEYLASAFTNSSGSLSTEIQIPTYLEDIFVQVHSAGFGNQKKIPVTSQISLEFGGIPEPRSMESNNKFSNDPIHISDNYYYMGTFNEGILNGLPHYLEPDGDDLSQDFLNDVDASLPENNPVPTHNPHYLTSGNELDVVVMAQSDVWVTFVTEGAGYRNTLGYYVFDTDNPPANVSEIDSVHIVLPNASLANSGGELNAGDKIRLGTFPAGKTISWVLLQNAWTGTGVDVDATKFYSRIDFNTAETDPSKRQHTVQLADFGNELLLIGFEDQTRSHGSDDDFNDMIFYVSANPWESISTGSIPQVTPSVDSDDDGISDENDDFPSDPQRALRNTYEGSLAFEDLWPAEGDYDFNDMVIDYEIDHIVNGNNLLVDIEADWTIKAVFASFSNGFGIELNDLPSGDVSSVNGLNLTDGIVSLNGNGTEANQSSATVVFFDNVFDVVQASGSPYPHTSPVTILNTTINFNTPVSQSTTGYPPYNPFIFIDGNRSQEVHLAGKEPTDLANTELFGTSSDATDPASNYYYKTAEGLPWAINISESFDFPKAGIPISEAYNFFSTWATSGGQLNADWYRDIPGNREDSKIY